MAKRLRVLGGILLVGCGIGAVEASCSSPGSQEPEPVGQSVAALARIIHARAFMKPDGSVAGAPLPECFIPTGVQVLLAVK